MLVVAICLVTYSLSHRVATAQSQPNVIMITVDDLNQWIGPLRGHPNARTPSIDEFSRNAIVFRNAVCPAPVCGPSRSSILSGFMPNRTGVYNNSSNMLNSRLVQNNATLPEYFSRHGYHTLSTGKVFHGHDTANGEDVGQWAFDTYFDDPLFDTPDESKVTDSRINVINGQTPSPNLYPDGDRTKGLAWGPTEDRDFRNTGDYRKVEWANEQLRNGGGLQEPFFMSVGIYKPHVPWFVPQRFFNRHPLKNIQTPNVHADDLDDIVTTSGRPQFRPQRDFEWVDAFGLEKEATRAYLACVSEADAAIGILLNKLERSRFADNTIVVISGDHGWHLGEKLRYHKNTLWQESALTPLIVRTPEVRARTSQTTYCNNMVNLVDLFPTLIDLCGLPKKRNLDGESFTDMLDSPSTNVAGVGVTIGRTGVSVMSRRWHYIENTTPDRVTVNSQEFYDRRNDPDEENNLLANPNRLDSEQRRALGWLQRHVPSSFADPVASPRPASTPRHLDETIRPARAHLR